MSAKTTILHENGTDDELYPVTKASATYRNDGTTTVEGTLADYDTLETKFGDTSATLPTTAQTVVGAIEEHESDIDDIKDDISTLNGNLTNKIKYVDAAVTTGTTVYEGYYYADITIPTNLGTFLCAMPMFTTSNRPVFLVRYSTTQVRAYSPVASTEVNIRSLFFN